MTNSKDKMREEKDGNVNKVDEAAHEPMEMESSQTVNNPNELIPSAIRREFDPDAYRPIEVPTAPDRVSSYSEDGPRLMISHIDNTFFKSYAGTVTLGPFNKCFTSIVGPNGSGKSNVIDSMLFVFGFRASKIRSKKISVLIHHSDRYPDVDSCTVTVFFQMIKDTGPGDDEYEIVEGSKFRISRTAHRDNSSYYSINDRRSQYKDVAALLRSKGIDLDHNRFLILQGEVEQIAMMKPKAQTEHDEGMLEFLEDIIGSSCFQQPIQILTSRVEELNEIRVEKLSRVKAIEKEKANLEGPRDEALQYLTMENEITTKKNLVYHLYVRECMQEEEKITVELDKIKEILSASNTKLQELKKMKQKKQSAYSKMQRSYDEVNNEIELLKTKFSDFEKKDVKCREDTKHANDNVKKIEKNLSQEHKKVETLRKVPEENAEKITELKRSLAELEQNKKVEDDKLIKVMQELKDGTKDLQAEKDSQESELLSLQKSVNEAKSKYEVSKSQLDILLSGQEKETKRLETMKGNFQKSLTTIDTKKEELKSLEKNLSEGEPNLIKYKQELSSVAEAGEKATSQLNTLRSKVEVAKSALDSAKSRSKVLDEIIKQKTNKSIPGIYGRLGDLGGIDDKYDVAISTACGMLDHIVCDHVDTAQKCVEHLKVTGSGVASFIGLNMMEKWIPYTTKKITTPENVPRLFDLLRINDSAILPAFYFALRDTLVAKDLDQATRIAYGSQRFRVVTLQGHLIDQSGTMSGGGKTVCKGRMGSSASVTSEYTPEQIKSIEANIQQCQQERDRYMSEKDNLEDNVHKLSKDMEVVKQSLKKCTLDIKATEEQKTTLQTQINEQEKIVEQSTPDEKKVKDLRNNVMLLKKDYDKCASSAAKIESEVKRLHEKIMDFGAAKINPVQSSIDSLSKNIDQTSSLITKATVAIKTNDRNLKKAEDKVKSLESELSETKEQIQNLEKLYQEIENEAMKVMQSQQEYEENVKLIEKDMAEVRQELADVEEKEATNTREHVDLKHEFEQHETVVRDNQLRTKHWKKELSKLKLNKIEREDSEDLPAITDESMDAVNKEEVQYEISVQEEKLAQMKPNMAAIEDYRKKEEIYLQKVQELERVTDVRNQQRNNLEDMRKHRLTEFMNGFGIITSKLKEMYRMITLGGDAELELVNSLDPFSEGIVFSVRPKFKSWKNICNLSGGEKTLSSLALVFALHHYKPTPIYVMDEIDAALDFRNVSIVGNYIKDRTKNAQFIVISLRSHMFELADLLIGIYKTNDCTKSVKIHPGKMVVSEQQLS